MCLCAEACNTTCRRCIETLVIRRVKLLAELKSASGNRTSKARASSAQPQTGAQSTTAGSQDQRTSATDPVASFFDGTFFPHLRGEHKIPMLVACLRALAEASHFNVANNRDFGGAKRVKTPGQLTAEIFYSVMLKYQVCTAGRL